MRRNKEAPDRREQRGWTEARASGGALGDPQTSPRRREAARREQGRRDKREAPDRREQRGWTEARASGGALGDPQTSPRRREAARREQGRRDSVGANAISLAFGFAESSLILPPLLSPQSLKDGFAGAKKAPDRRRRLLALCVALALLLLCGCGTDASTLPRRSVALIVKSTDSEFFLSVFAGGRAAATEYNLDLTISGPETEEDYEAQNRMIGEAVEAGVDAIVFSAIDYEKNAAAIDAAAQAGVRIVSIDSGVGSGHVSTYIGTDNYAAGRMAAQAALERVEGPLCVGVVNYDEGTANGQQREQGAVDALAESGRAQVAAVVNTLTDAGHAQADAAGLLRAHPEINVLMAFNEPTSVGAAQAVRDMGLSDSVFFVGFDSNVVTIDGLQDGCVDALIVQNPYAMGYLGVESAYKLLTGQEDSLEPMVDTATQIVDRENLFTMDGQKALFAFDRRQNWAK